MANFRLANFVVQNTSSVKELIDNTSVSSLRENMVRWIDNFLDDIEIAQRKLHSIKTIWRPRN